MTKDERLRIFMDRLHAAPAVNSRELAYVQLSDILTAVEDEFSGIAANPALWMTDGRLYPPLPDYTREVRNMPGVFRYRHRFHVTFIGPNGCVEIQTLSEQTIFSKAGADGMHLRDL